MGHNHIFQHFINAILRFFFRTRVNYRNKDVETIDLNTKISISDYYSGDQAQVPTSRKPAHRRYESYVSEGYAF